LKQWWNELWLRDGWHWYFAVIAMVWGTVFIISCIIGVWFAGWLVLPLAALFATFFTARFMEEIAA